MLIWTIDGTDHAVFLSQMFPQIKGKAAGLSDAIEF